LVLAALVESGVRQLEPTAVLRSLVLLLLWAAVLEGISTPVKMLACQEVQAEGVLEVAPEQAAQVLLDKATRAVLVSRERHLAAAVVAALVLLALTLLRVQAAQAAQALQAA
jgi:hypothetical protein